MTSLTAKQRFDKHAGDTGYVVDDYVDENIGWEDVVEAAFRGHPVIPEEVMLPHNKFFRKKHGVFVPYNAVDDLRELKERAYTHMPLELLVGKDTVPAQIRGFIVSGSSADSPRYIYSSRNVIEAQRFANTFWASAREEVDDGRVAISANGLQVVLLGVDSEDNYLTVNATEFPSLSRPDGETHNPSWTVQYTPVHERHEGKSTFYGQRVAMHDHQHQRGKIITAWNGHLADPLKRGDGTYAVPIPHLHAQDIAAVLIADRWMREGGFAINHPFKEFREGLEMERMLREEGSILHQDGRISILEGSNLEVVLNAMFGVLAQKS